MKKHQIIFYTALIALLLSCNNKESKLKLNLENKQLYFLASKDSSFYSSNQRHYSNKLQREKSFNLVSYTLTNPTSRSVLLLIKDLNLIDVYGLRINVKKENINIIADRPMSDFGKEVIDSCSFCKSSLIFKQEAEEFSKLKLLGAKKNIHIFKSFLTQSVILEPYETREFSAVISLPFVRESDPSTLQNNYSYDLRPNNNYTFSLSYEIDKTELLKELTLKQIDELTRNNIEIYDGKLISNEVKLIPRF